MPVKENCLDLAAGKRGLPLTIGRSNVPIVRLALPGIAREAFIPLGDARDFKNTFPATRDARIVRAQPLVVQLHEGRTAIRLVRAAAEYGGILVYADSVVPCTNPRYPGANLHGGLSFLDPKSPQGRCLRRVYNPNRIGEQVQVWEIDCAQSPEIFFTLSDHTVRRYLVTPGGISSQGALTHRQLLERLKAIFLARSNERPVDVPALEWAVHAVIGMAIEHQGAYWKEALALLQAQLRLAQQYSRARRGSLVQASPVDRFRQVAPHEFAAML